MHKIEEILVKLFIVIPVVLLTLVSCSGRRVIEDRDNHNRAIKLTYYDGGSVDRVEEIAYKGNSSNPSEVIYKKYRRSKLIPYKLEKYRFFNNDPVIITTYALIGNRRIRTGQIRYYYYANNEPKRKEFYTYIKAMKKMFIFGVYQYKYKNEALKTLHINKYEFNPLFSKSMQVEQHMVFYTIGNISHMKSYVMEKKSRKLVEINERDPQLISDIINSIEKKFESRSKSDI